MNMKLEREKGELRLVAEGGKYMSVDSEGLVGWLETLLPQSLEEQITAKRARIIKAVNDGADCVLLNRIVSDLSALETRLEREKTV